MQNTDRISYVLLFLYWLSTWRIPSRQFTDDHFEGSVSEDGGQFSFLFPDSMSPESQTPHEVPDPRADEYPG